MAFWPGAAGEGSFVFLTAAPLLAAAACLWRGQRDREPRLEGIDRDLPGTIRMVLHVVQSTQHTQRVRQTREGLRREHRCVDQAEQTLPQGQQMPGEIAAVDRRNILRAKRVERVRVVPVVEMAAILLHPFDGGDRLLHALNRLFEAQPAEVTGGDDGEKIDADIGR